jgi:hypothetical protein
MAENHKTINVDLFAVTKKTKRKKPVVSIPINNAVNPNTLKMKFLKKIKEHKKIKQAELNDVATIHSLETKSQSKEPSTDEFSDSMEYLQSLSQKKINDARQMRRTARQPRQPSSSSSIPMYTELPPELSEFTVPLTTQPYQVDFNQSMILPTSESRCIAPVSQLPTDKPIIELPKPKEEPIVSTPNIVFFENNETKIKNDLNSKPENDPKPNTDVPFGILKNGSKPSFRKWKRMQQIKRTQKQTKRTIHKTYTLGKSKTTRQIGVLIKDIETKHKINEATKNIKNTALHDMKVYLKNHNLIRVGSDAPPAVVKKLYESAVMSGDILNQNTEQMLVNLEAGDNV